MLVKFPVYDEAGVVNGGCGISTDITAVKKAQDQLRRLSGRIMANQEKERAAIARGLHDELGQVLTALRMDAVWMQERLKEREPGIAERALTMCSLIDKTIKDVRSIATRLRPGVLDDLGLVDALESLLCVRHHFKYCSFEVRRLVVVVSDFFGREMCRYFHKFIKGTFFAFIVFGKWIPIIKNHNDIIFDERFTEFQCFNC